MCVDWNTKLARVGASDYITTAQIMCAYMMMIQLSGGDYYYYWRHGHKLLQLGYSLRSFSSSLLLGHTLWNYVRQKKLHRLMHGALRIGCGAPSSGLLGNTISFISLIVRER